MTTTTIPDNIRTEIYEEAGPSAILATIAALNLWPANRVGALRMMWRDGADVEWLERVAAKLGVPPAEAESLAEEATR